MPATANTEEAVRVEKSFYLRCFLYHQKSTGMYVAECIDLDLIVKAKSPKKAKRELRDAVMGYVRVAVETHQDNQLIPRPSPLLHRIHYHALATATKIPRIALLPDEASVYSCEPSFAQLCYA